MRCALAATRSGSKRARGLAELFGLEPLTPTEDSFVQMLAGALPPCDVWEIQSRLLDEFGIEVLLMELAGVPLVRVSLQAYNDESDVDALVARSRANLRLTSALRLHAKAPPA